MFKPTKQDWPEDWKGENGNYHLKCVQCGKEFIGHKRRVLCKACHILRQTTSQGESK